MRNLRGGGLLIAVLALAGVAAGCGESTAGAAYDTGTSATSQSAASPGTVSPGTASPSAISPSTGATSPTSKAGSGKHASMLNGVSCAGRLCVAVGGWYSGPPAEHTLAELWNAAAWQLEKSPDGPRGSVLAAVSCTPRNPVGPGSAPSASCLAVGSPVLARPPGGQWRVVSKASYLDAVSCHGSTCVAVGSNPDHPVALFATWDGTTLRPGTMPVPARDAQAVTVAGVSCPAADDCVAVGDYSYGVGAQPGPAGRDKSLAEEWNGRSWRQLPTVDVSHWNSLSAVSCFSAANCTAVGWNQNQFPLAEHWNGTTWQVEPVPALSSPATLGYAQLDGVSCPAARLCVASGTFEGVSPFVATWNGARWRLTRLTLPAGSQAVAGGLAGVSCASTVACVAVGNGSAADSYAEICAHGTWHFSATRNPA